MVKKTSENQLEIKFQNSNESQQIADAFISWWFDHQEDSRFFNEMMKASPALAKRAQAILVEKKHG